MGENEQHEEKEVAWPACPDCGRRRLTVCPVCGTAGTEFQRADANFAVGLGDAAPRPSELALICSTCDEPWLAEFLRRCEWCGHDFGEGLATESVPASEPTEPNLNRRAMFVMFALAAIFVALIAYFAAIAGR